MNISRGQWLLAFLVAGTLHAAMLGLLLVGAPAPQASDDSPRGVMVSLDTIDPGPPAKSAADSAPAEAAQPEPAAPVTAPAATVEPTTDNATPQKPQAATEIGPKPADVPPGQVDSAAPGNAGDSAATPASEPQIANAVTVRPDNVSQAIAPENEITARQAGDVNGETQPDVPSNGAFGSSEQATDDYIVRVRGWLARHKQYPAAARANQVEGTVRLYLVIDAAGNLISQRIVESSGSAMLDKAAKQMLARSEPLPRMSSSMRRNRLELVVPVVFSLR